MENQPTESSSLEPSLEENVPPEAIDEQQSNQVQEEDIALATSQNETIPSSSSVTEEQLSQSEGKTTSPDDDNIVQHPPEVENESFQKEADISLNSYPDNEDSENKVSDKTLDTSNFTEKSINISQINVSQNDDSNDAFNALKETEIDALNTKDEPLDEEDHGVESGELNSPEDEGEMKEQQQQENEQDEEQENVQEGDQDEKEQDNFTVPQDSEIGESNSENVNKEISDDENLEPADQSKMDVDEHDSQKKADENLSNPDPDIEMDSQRDEDAEKDKVDQEKQEDINESAEPENVDKDETEIEKDDNNKDESNNTTAREDEIERMEEDKPEEIEDTTAEAEDIGTTTEGEGVDENVCLLGDAEREITDADKERALLANEAAEEDENLDESSSVNKDVSEPIEIEDHDETEETITDPNDKDTEDHDHDQAEDQADSMQAPLKENEIREVNEAEGIGQTCLNCENVANCAYRLLEESGEVRFLCSFNCVSEHREDNPGKYFLTQKKMFIYLVPDTLQTCEKCKSNKLCKYRFLSAKEQSEANESETAEENAESEPKPESEVEFTYLCNEDCLQSFVDNNVEKYVVKRKKYVIDEISEEGKELKCIECNDVKSCKYKFVRHDDNNAETYVCNEDCLNLLLKEQPETFRVKRRSVRVREQPKRVQQEEMEVAKIVARTDIEVEAARLDRDASFIRRCAQCFEIVPFTAKTIQWETHDFCDEKCLGQYQNLIGAACTTCNNAVTMASLGKYCVRFGFDVKQFCCSACLDVYKKGLKQCTLCQRDLSGEENVVLAKVGEKGQFKDFCNQICLKRFEEIINPKKKTATYLCSVCNNQKPAKVEVCLEGGVHKFCSNPCFSAFKFVNNVFPDQCEMCFKFFERKSNDAHTIFCEDNSKMFCSKICMNIYICKTREIWQCNWCKVSKYNYDMIVRNFGKSKMCSLNCLTLFEVSVNALSRKRVKCDHCKILKQPQYHLTMSDASIRNFCTYQCVLGFQSQFNKKPSVMDGDESAVVPAGTAKRIKPPAKAESPVAKSKPVTSSFPVISRVQSLSTGRRSRQTYDSNQRTRSPIPVPELTVQLEPLGDLPARVKISSLSSKTTSLSARVSSPSTRSIPTSTRTTSRIVAQHQQQPTYRIASPEVRIENKTQVVTIPPLPKQVMNKSTSCKPLSHNKGINCKVSTKTAECQTDDYLERKLVIPIPIPVYLPQPMYMYNLPTPIPVPVPIPIPVPVFVPTTRNSANGILKEIKKIQEKMPTDPYEAELLMMAEMVAGDKKREETDSDSDNDVGNDIEYGDAIENNSSFNEDLVQMAFKMAGNDFDDPPVDLENEMTANTISQNTHPYGEDLDPQSLHHHQLLLLQQQREAAAAAAALQANRNRKRMNPQKPNNNNSNNRNTTPNKRIKREMEVMPQQEIPREPAEKPDANMCLKFTFGVNAWKQWVATKNADLEKSSIRRKPFKSEILQLTADELNYSLCLFVKEVRKPNGSEYAPDTIYYLVLGIQQYLYENGRIDNIFTDRYYEQFTDCLDEVAKKFSVLYNDSQYIVTRVEEEHLWECKQLGAHSPHVLLSTLMFFNTKHFNLVTVDEHMELSFSHIMKHWKRNPNQPGAAKMPGSRNVLLRFYPPQSSLEANSRKKKVYEQQENEENPLRCPVKLYEFYLSKCPESVKTRNDVFYLQPERSCVPDSPVWYSTQPLSRDALSKMLHRVKMVKEINIALLTS